MDAAGDSGSIIDSIRTQLEGLKRTEDGTLLYRLIERGLGKRPGDGSSTDEAFLTFMYTLLERYAKNRDGDPITRIKVRVIQQRITPYLMEEEAPEPDSVAVGVEEPAVDEVPEEAGAEADDEVAEAEAEAGSAEESVSAPEPEPEESAEKSEVQEFDLELIDSDQIDKELQDEKEQEQPLELVPDEPASGTGKVTEARPQKSALAEKEAASTRPQKPMSGSEQAEGPKPVAEKPAAKPKARPNPSKSKKKPAKVAPRPEAKKPEPPKKPVKLELVEPTDLTKPHSGKEAKKEEKEEGYIDLGDETPAAGNAARPAAARKPSVAAKKQQPAQKAPSAKKPARAKQELMPKAAKKQAAKSAVPEKSGEPSQERVEKLHEAFVHKMAESITRSQDYHRLLRSHMKAIELAENEDDFRDLKSLLMRGIDDLLKGNEALGRDLDSTNHYLKIARLDRALLKDELGRIKDNTTIDQLTALQNKEAFIKQLESEISRVNRYGFSFAIAVLDIDDLKSINTAYGRDAGDEVIRCYARQILSQFRSYDLVARHKSDEFLLLFPNTQKEGALRAVEKAQKRAANLYINHKDKNIKVPTFTSVLTTYSPGDQPDTLLRRTSEALAQAQKRGRDQVILALPTA